MDILVVVFAVNIFKSIGNKAFFPMYYSIIELIYRTGVL